MRILLQLFFAFIQVGLFSVGGGYAAIPLIQNQIVDIHGLMTLPEFTDLITIAEMTPGPISINSATFVGMRLAGIPGVLLCTLGCILPSFCICLALAHFYYKYRSFSGVQTVLSALRPAVVALIASAGLSILLLAIAPSGLAQSALADIHWVEVLVFLGALYLLRKRHPSAIAVIFGSGVVGTAAYALLGVL
ncbi:MAG: chromate transporter [Pygmaiobacter massiliensis]|nr:chromate transporter [Pygmaiobacter massiliensis]